MPHTAWQGKTADEKESLFDDFLTPTGKCAKTVTSSNGVVTMPATPRIARSLVSASGHVRNGLARKPGRLNLTIVLWTLIMISNDCICVILNLKKKTKNNKKT